MKHTIAKHTKPCGCGKSVCLCNIYAEQEALSACVNDFAYQMKIRLSEKYNSGKSGWEDASEKYLLEALKKNLDEGKMVDVANLAMFIWNSKHE